MTKRTFQWLHALAFFGGALLVLVVFLNCFTVTIIPSESMLPTYEVDDVLINVKTRQVQRGDVVIFYRGEGEQRLMYIKRCVALAGDTVEVRDGALWRNGRRLEEPYLNEPEVYGSFGPYTVPDGTMFVMGDNRNCSRDSRFFGPIPLEDMLCKPILRFSF